MTGKLTTVLAAALLCASCRNDPAAPVGDTPAPATAQASASAATSSAPLASALALAAPDCVIPEPAPSASAAAPPASEAPASPPPTESAAYCVTAAESQEIAKPHVNADPPYSTCAAGIFSHCGGGNGERGHLCSRPLDPKATAASRKTKPNTCCYRSE